MKEYYSNCLIEALKQKIKFQKIKLYFCKPRITENGNFQMCHFMWDDGENSYDFTDKEEEEMKWYKCFWYKGHIRKLEKGFAEKYSNYRNK